MRKEVQNLQKGRDSFKEQFLDLREINKDLRQRFMEIERQVSQYLSEEEKWKRNYDDKENSKQENSKQRTIILEDIQSLIKEYRKNAIEKKNRYAFNPLNDQENY